MNTLYRLKYKHDFSDFSYIHELAACTSEIDTFGSVKKSYLRFLDCRAKLKVNIKASSESQFKVTKYSATFVNDSDSLATLNQFDAGIVIPAKELMLNYFTSDWGSEFFPHETNVVNEFSYGSVAGRSCRGFIPWAGITTHDGCYAVALAWSGNWKCTILPQSNSFYFSMGMGDIEGFEVKQGENFESVPFYVAKGNTPEDASLQMRRFYRAKLSLLKDRDIQSEIPLLYNGWWPFEDKDISEKVYYENSVAAKELGINYAVLDAGWFGDGDDALSWYDKRGDWSSVNKAAFPSGIKKMFEGVSEIGIKPGLWCEIEAVGKNARLNESHRDLIAERDGESLGHICFGSDKSVRWAMDVVDRIAGEYGAKWIKFDFNLDPGKGCNASHHNHSAGDGLYRHYLGYYKFLKEVRVKYPDVVLENCSSGGLRMDIEMLSHTHWTHLSDPDYTELHLQCFWGALSYLHQSACLHFSWSQVLGEHNCGVKNPINENMKPYELDYIIRAVLMGVPGFSYALTQLPEWCLKRLKEHIEFYSRIYKDYILNGDAYRLTAQPLMDGKGERFPVFQFNSRDLSSLLFAFRLDKSEPEQKVYPKGLFKERIYSVKCVDSEKQFELTGKMIEESGLIFSDMPKRSSRILVLKCKKDSDE